MRRHLALVGLIAFSACTGRGSSVPERATASPDAGQDAATNAFIDASTDASIARHPEVEGETATDIAEYEPLSESEEAPSDDAYEDEHAAAGKGPGCSLTQKHLHETQDAILAAPLTPNSAAPRTSWDHRSPLARLDIVKRRFGLTNTELATLTRQGFVVPARLSLPSYAVAYHELYQSELPIYITVDSIFHTVFATNDEIIEVLEGRRLAPLLNNALQKLHEALPAASSSYMPDVAADLDLYLTVARTLSTGTYINSDGPQAAQARALVEMAMKADAMTTVDLFGRPRIIDFSQYKLRGHYAKRRALARYFRAAMWLSRLELNLVSRSCRSSQPGFTVDPTETPREAMLALALADLAERSGAMADISLLDTAWGLLAGPREDVPLQKLAEMRKTAGIGALTSPDAADKLRAAIGSHFRRTARLHYMPEGSTELPAITTMLGPRVVADAFATRPLVHGETPNRYDISVADIAYAFGHDRAKRYLAADIAQFPDLAAQLAKARAIVGAPLSGSDLYGAWFSAIRALSDNPSGALPSFMDTEAFQDLRLGSFVSAYGQLKHNYTLMAGQPYDEGACAVPDGFVEPARQVYQALATYAERGQTAMAMLDPKGALGSASYFKRLGKLMRVLDAISEAELQGLPLSKEALTFLSMVVEIHGVDIGTGFTTTYNGWYFDLFLDRPAGTTAPPPGRANHPSMKSASFIADYYTSTNTQTVAYAGAAQPRLGVFVIDVGGAPRVVVGPVAHGYEHRGPLSNRLTDEASTKLTTLTEPWSESYVVAGAPAPPLVIDVEVKFDPWIDEVAQGRSRPLDIRIRGARPLGAVTVELLDHHRRSVASMTKQVGVTETIFAFPSRRQRVLPGTRAAEMLKISVGGFQGWVDLLDGPLPQGFGGMSPSEPAVQ